MINYYYTYNYNRHIGEHYARIFRGYTTSDTMYNIRISAARITNTERRVTKTTKTTGKTINTII